MIARRIGQSGPELGAEAAALRAPGVRPEELRLGGEVRPHLELSLAVRLSDVVGSHGVTPRGRSREPTRAAAVERHAKSIPARPNVETAICEVCVGGATSRGGPAQSAIANICPCQPFSSNRLDRVNPCFSYQ